MNWILVKYSPRVYELLDNHANILASVRKQIVGGKWIWVAGSQSGKEVDRITAMSKAKKALRSNDKKIQEA